LHPHAKHGFFKANNKGGDNMQSRHRLSSYSQLAAALILVLMLFLSCATNPVTKKAEFVLMTEEQEILLGQEMNPQILEQDGVYASEELQEYVEKIGKRLAKVSDRPDLLFHFKVVDSPLVNAFALPGGYVYVTRGILAYINSEAELAGVLGHEIGHVTARHAVRQYTKAAAYQIAAGVASVFFPQISNFGQFADFVFVAITRGYSREFELESDQLAIEYTTKAGYNPKAVSSFLSTLELLDRIKGEKSYHGFFATHPEIEKRVALAESEALSSGIPASTSSLIRRSEYLSEIDGLVFGPDIKEGVTAGNKFQHPDLQIELHFPKGWAVQNKPDVVMAKDPDRENYLQLRLQNLIRRSTAQGMAEGISQNLGFKEISGVSKMINGLDAYVGTYEGRSRNLGFIMVRAGFFIVEDMVHYVIGFSRPEEFKTTLPFFDKTIRSFRHLSQAEATQIQPNRIRLHKVKSRETLTSIINELGVPADDVKTFALINAMEPAKPLLEPGMTIKVIKNR
jgi:predicted Zn-dependent protease